jgi:hypothetical protein
MLPRRIKPHGGHRYRVSDDFLEAEGIDAWLVGGK